MLSSILQYSTIDIKFLDLSLQQLSKFSDEIIIPICSHLFDGEPESEELLTKSIAIMAKYPKAQPYMFQWQGPKENTAYYHNMSRALGTECAQGDWLFFVDADEIPDDNIIDWLPDALKKDYTYWLTCYWYWREPIYRAKQVEGCGLLIKKSRCFWQLDVRPERQQFHHPAYNFQNGQYLPIHGNDNMPMMHHFSWYRTKDEMLAKVKNWAHAKETDHFTNTNGKNWTQLIEEEFSRPFNGKDFMHNYQYDIVENKFNI